MKNRATLVVRMFAVLWVVYALLRLAFLFLYFPGEEWTFFKVARLFYWGFRMDFAALFYINLPFLLYYFFMEPFLKFSWKNQISLALFSIINLPFLAINFLDLVYYRFNHRRSTVDLFDVLSDSSSAFQFFLSQFWYVLIIFILAGISVVLRTKRIIKRTPVHTLSVSRYLVSSLFLLLLGALMARGIAARPLLPSSALLYFEARYQPLVSNSTFNFMYSIIRKQTTLQNKTYFTNEALNNLYPVHHQFKTNLPFRKRNIVFFVLESFSKEYFKGGSKTAKMPFFDSLIQHSTVFNNAFANALESNKGLPAILASMPEVMDEPIYLSNYSNIPFKGIGHILKEEGYNTSFFLGAEYDHFGFARLCKMVGIDDYFSRKNYDERDGEFDGTWGIYDEYFFEYFAKEAGRRGEPFFSVLFNISSHYPYRIPAESAGKINVPFQQPDQNSVTYVDWCFQQLFRNIQNQPWFNNTLFVFVADHGYRFSRSPDEQIREMRIPLFIYDPQQPVHYSIDKVIKQIDVVPSVLHKMNYAKPFTSFGSSVFSEAPAFSVNRFNGMYQYIDSAVFFGYDDINERLIYHYRYQQDSLLKTNLLNQGHLPPAEKVDRLKALLQRVNNALVTNSLN